MLSSILFCSESSHTFYIYHYYIVCPTFRRLNISNSAIQFFACCNLFELIPKCTVLSQHWHGFALSAQIRICYTEDAQKHTKIESCCEQTPGLGVCFLHREKKRRSIFEHIQQPAAASAAEEKSGALALRRLARRQYLAASDSAGFSHNNLGKSDGDHEGRLSTNSSHLHHRRHRHRFCCAFDDEFLTQRPDGRGIACMAQTHRDHMGDPERSRLHHGLCHAVLLRWSVDGIKHGDS